jgi:hypothetical protein
MRLVEAIESYNLIINLSRKGKLEEYYNADAGTLEHFKFKELFIRHNKKVFISFVPKDIIQNIIAQEPVSKYDSLQGSIRKRGMKQRFGDVREAMNEVYFRLLQILNH